MKPEERRKTAIAAIAPAGLEIVDCALALASAGFAVAPGRKIGEGVRNYKELQSPHVPSGGARSSDPDSVRRSFAAFPCADAIAAWDADGRQWDVEPKARSVEQHTEKHLAGHGILYASRSRLPLDHNLQLETKKASPFSTKEDTLEELDRRLRDQASSLQAARAAHSESQANLQVT